MMLNHFDRDLLESFELSRIGELLEAAARPTVAFDLDRSFGFSWARSKLGGRPYLTADFRWPNTKKRPLDFLLQIDLADVNQFAPVGVLPDSGLLTFFYDLENQPWGYDPAELDGFHVELITETSLVAHEAPSSVETIQECHLKFNAGISLPYFGSRAFDRLKEEVRMSEDEEDRYLDFIEEYVTRSGNHQLLGHSANIQGDMQLEAQLVTNGLYCGDLSGWQDPRAKELEAGADDWILLLQLDSDDIADLMWGDSGMLYFWIRANDLSAQRFDRAWMCLQCG